MSGMTRMEQYCMSSYMSGMEWYGAGFYEQYGAILLRNGAVEGVV